MTMRINIKTKTFYRFFKKFFTFLRCTLTLIFSFYQFCRPQMPLCAVALLAPPQIGPCTGCFILLRSPVTKKDMLLKYVQSEQTTTSSSVHSVPQSSMKGGATKHAHGSQRREIGKENVINTAMAVRGLNASALERIVCRNGWQRIREWLGHIYGSMGGNRRRSRECLEIAKRLPAVGAASRTLRERIVGNAA